MNQVNWKHCHQFLILPYLYVACLHPRPAEAMAYMLLLSYGGNECFRPMLIILQKRDVLGSQELFLWISATVCSQSHTHQSSPVPRHVQVLSTFSFMDIRSFQQELGTLVEVTGSALPWVVEAINQLVLHYIKFPHTTEEQATGLPNSSGSTHCSHVVPLQVGSGSVTSRLCRT